MVSPPLTPISQILIPPYLPPQSLFSLGDEEICKTILKESELKTNKQTCIGQNKQINIKTKSQRQSTRNTYSHRATHIGKHRKPTKTQNW